MHTEKINEFLKFISKDLNPGLNDLERLDRPNRVHIQKLVFTNLTDRFDHLIDKLILDNCREEKLLSKILDDKDAPVRESDFFRILLETNDLQKALTLRLQDKLRASILRERHSLKLSTLLDLCDGTGNVFNKPRVNISTGDIHDKFTVQNKNIPHSICGYADWLYSRRNAIVHGASSSKYLENDCKMIKKKFKVDLPKTFRISLASIRNAVTFYRAICGLIY